MFNIRHSCEVDPELAGQRSASFSGKEALSDLVGLRLVDLTVSFFSALRLGLKACESDAPISGKEMSPRPSPSVVLKARRINRVGSANVRNCCPRNVFATDSDYVGVCSYGVNIIGPLGGVADAPLARVHVRNVVFVGAHSQMIWIDAGWRIARVKNKIGAVNRAVSVFIGQAMSELFGGSPPGAEASIPLVVFRRHPKPAAGRVELIDFAPKSFIKHMLSFRPYGGSVAR